MKSIRVDDENYKCVRNQTPKFEGLERDNEGKPVKRKMIGTVDIYN